jgi:hypothetical protein
MRPHHVIKSHPLDKKGGLVKSKIITLLFPVLLLVVWASKTSATLYCNRSYTQLPQNPGRPYNAVGFLNNGCTAFLIDSNHIVAAAHCFENTTDGTWQTGLRFYPNFHPDRVVADEKHVPRGDVTHVVVGSRAGESVLGTGMDWAIARIDNWTDTTGLDLTPLALAPALPSLGTALENPAYTRHHFPYNDSDSVTWDNMQWDTTNCGWVGSNHGMWAIQMHTAPVFDGTNRDTVGCNSRWAAGMIHANCSLTSVPNDVVIHDCDTVGGSSGSPIIFKNAQGKWSVIGVGHGGGPADFSQLAPVCTNDTPDHQDNGGASVERFRDAPRFASNIAVHRRPDNASATAVFAIDSDLNQLVYRARSGSTPTYNSSFGFWKSLDTPLQGVKLTKVAACSVDATARPQVFVVINNQRIFTRWVLSNGGWSLWTDFGLQGIANTVVDIDTSTDMQGRCLLFATTEGGAFVRAKISDSTWGGWFTVANGTFRSITALNYNGVVWAAMVDASGEIWRTSLGQAGWTTPIKLTRPPGVSAWRDIDMTWDEAARGFMLALPTSGGNKLWFTPMYGNQAWSEWRFFDTHLWAPGATPQNAPNLQSITASRWMEDPPGTTSPVIFVTDDNGNVYFIEYGRVSTPGWILDWKSFYHETIPY